MTFVGKKEATALFEELRSRAMDKLRVTSFIPMPGRRVRLADTRSQVFDSRYANWRAVGRNYLHLRRLEFLSVLLDCVPRVTLDRLLTEFMDRARDCDRDDRFGGTRYARREKMLKFEITGRTKRHGEFQRGVGQLIENFIVGPGLSSCHVGKNLSENAIIRCTLIQWSNVHVTIHEGDVSL